MLRTEASKKPAYTTTEASSTLNIDLPHTRQAQVGSVALSSSIIPDDSQSLHQHQLPDWPNSDSLSSSTVTPNTSSYEPSEFNSSNSSSSAALLNIESILYEHHDAFLAKPEQLNSIFTSFRCSECPSTFSRQCDLNKHVFRIHEKRAKCPFEGCKQKPFGFQADLKRHISAKHSGHKKAALICSFPGCTETFSRKDNLMRHVKNRHSSQSSYGCCKV